MYRLVHREYMVDRSYGIQGGSITVLSESGKGHNPCNNKLYRFNDVIISSIKFFDLII